MTPTFMLQELHQYRNIYSRNQCKHSSSIVVNSDTINTGQRFPGNMARAREFDTIAALDRAVDLFWQRGYEATSMAQISAALALGQGSIYAAWGGKKQLFTAVIERYIDAVSRTAIAEIDSATSGTIGLHRYFDRLIDSIFNGKRRWGCLITNAAVERAAEDPKISARVATHFSDLRAAFARALMRDTAPTASDPAVSAVHTAEFLVCLVQGINVLAKTGCSRETLEQIVSTAFASVSNPYHSQRGAP
jgi:TetR/AcrR family transcriptional repressor of nem operon